MGKKKNKGGRPSKMDPLVIKKLEEAFAIDATVTEACVYADISTQTFYTWCKADPKLSDRLELLRNKPVLAARNNVVQAIGTGHDLETSKWYLERKVKSEFSSRQEMTGPGGAPIGDPDPKTKEKIDKIFRDNIKK